MSSIHNLSNLKMAKEYIEDLTQLELLYKQDIIKYQKYIKYNPVKQLLSTLETEYSHIKAHLSGLQKIVSTKGQIK